MMDIDLIYWIIDPWIQNLKSNVSYQTICEEFGMEQLLSS